MKGRADEIKVAYDERYQRNYYINKRTKKTGWSRKEVEDPAARLLDYGREGGWKELQKELQQRGDFGDMETLAAWIMDAKAEQLDEDNDGDMAEELRQELDGMVHASANFMLNLGSLWMLSSVLDNLAFICTCAKTYGALMYWCADFDTRVWYSRSWNVQEPQGHIWRIGRDFCVSLVPYFCITRGPIVAAGLYYVGQQITKDMGKHVHWVQFAHDAYTDRSAGDLVKFGACGGMSARVVQFIDLQQTGTEVMLYQVLPASMNTFVLAFRGTEGARCVTDTVHGGKSIDACADLYQDLIQTDFNWKPAAEGLCNKHSATDRHVHAGFLKAYLSVREQISAALQDTLTASSKLYITGHSLGGALASLSGYDLTCNPGRSRGVQPTIITLGSPAVFKDRRRFEKVIKRKNYLRAVAKGTDSFGFQQSDIITQLGGGKWWQFGGVIYTWTWQLGRGITGGYQQPNYPHLAVTPDKRQSICNWGRCHVIRGNYLKDEMYARPAWCGRCCSQGHDPRSGATGLLAALLTPAHILLFVVPAVLLVVACMGSGARRRGAGGGGGEKGGE
eukprot:g1821.t1